MKGYGKVLAYGFVAAVGLLGWAPAHAAKVDTLSLRNGDRITGEIKSLDKGRLSYSTDDAGTLSIEWDKVARLVSPRYFDIELDSGRHLYGRLVAAPSPGTVHIADAADSLVLGILTVVRIAPLESGILDRIDGSLDFGLSLARANHFVQTSIDGSARYRTKTHTIRLRMNSLVVKQDDADDTQRGSIVLDGAHALGDRWYTAASTGVERNQELGLDARYSLAVLGGRFMTQTNTFVSSAAAGLSGNLENPGSDADWNLEAVAMLDADYFTYDFPKSDIGATLNLYRSLLESRTRMEFEATVKREVFKDFMVGIQGVDSYDSDPPADGTHNDWTIQLTVGWTF